MSFAQDSFEHGVGRDSASDHGLHIRFGTPAAASARWRHCLITDTLIHAAHAGLLKVGGKYKTEVARFPADVAVGMTQAAAPLHLYTELRDGDAVLVAVLFATTLGHFRAGAVLRAPGWAAAVCRVRASPVLRACGACL